MGWFFGFKLHLAVNDQGNLLACCLTPGNVDDRKPISQMVKHLRCKLIGDRGSVSASLAALFFEQGLQLITRLCKSMTNHIIHLLCNLLLRKRVIIESIIDQLKNISETRAFSSLQRPHQFCRPFDCWAHCFQLSGQKAQPASG
jgi:hypothetical protein